MSGVTLSMCHVWLSRDCHDNLGIGTLPLDSALWILSPSQLWELAQDDYSTRALAFLNFDINVHCCYTQYSTYFCLTLLTGACLQNLAIIENLCSQELERPCLNASKMPSLNIVNINHQCQNCITPHGPDQLRHDTSQENCPLPGARNQAHGIYMLRFSHSSCTQPLWK